MPATLVVIAIAAAGAAPEPPPYLSAPRPPWPLVMLHRLLSSDDYPPAALRNEERGDVDFRLAIGRDGRVSGCTITGSSGSAILDSATCRTIQARARFAPARDADGRPTSDRLRGRMSWRLPR